MAAVHLREVSKQVGSMTILESVNLEVKKGEFLVIVGPSGCGKSTLLRLIAGLDDISSGQILINQQCVNTIPPAKRDMAMVFQNYALYPHMTVFDNMAYGLKMRRFSKMDIKQRVEEVAKLLHLVPYLTRKPHALSGGQRQRVAMGRAMVRSPAVFLFDEPLSNLDAKLRTEMRHEIKRLHQQFNTTSLYVTHDHTEAMTMAERILVLNQGVVEQVGAPQELYHYPKTLFVAGFTGHYPINFLDAVFDKNTNLAQTRSGFKYPVPIGVNHFDDKEDMVLAIRPEHLVMCNQQQENSIAIKIEFVDDMGADQLIQGRCVKTGQHISLRLYAGEKINSDTIYVQLPLERIHLFQAKSGMRIGD